MNNILVWLLQFILPRRYWYRKFYLRSRHWREIRFIKFGAVGYACEVCRIKPYNGTHDVHHLTYARIWHERLNDLKVLCRKCHKLEHSKG